MANQRFPHPPLDVATWITCAFLTACATPHAIDRNKPAKVPQSLVQLKLPAQVDDENYQHMRQLYDALPLHHRQRPAFRQLIRSYLIRQANVSLNHNRDDELMTAYMRVATLYDPTEVYSNSVHDLQLGALSRKILSRYAPRGDEQRVLPALSVLVSLDRDASARHRKTFDEAVSWVENTAEALHGRAFRGHRVIRAMERVTLIWPSAFVLEQTHALYLKRIRALAALTGKRPNRRRAELMFPAMRLTGYNVARMYLWVDRPYTALTKLRNLGTRGADGALRRRLERVVSPVATVDDMLRLAELFEERDPQVARRTCQMATRRFKAEPRTHACVGELAAKTNHISLSIAAYEEARRLSPGSRRFAEALSKQHQREIFQLIEVEQLSLAQDKLAKLERYHTEAASRLGKPLKASLGRVYYAVGYGLYNAGRAEEAKALLTKSVLTSNAPESLIQLAVLATKAEDGRAALGYLAKLDSIPMKNKAAKLYWAARSLTVRGRALVSIKQHSKSKKAHRKAEKTWKKWLSKGLRPQMRAEAHIARSRSLFALRRTVEAVDALEKAIDAAPGRKETYADAIALLVTHGHLPEALDAYHRALGRPEVTEYLKTYCTFWVVGLARRGGRPPDPIGIDYLTQLSGNKWYHSLSKFVLGQESYEALTRKAKTAAQRTELQFYAADSLAAAGKMKQARKLWQQVIASGMMAFFEYDMALHNLRKGPARVAIRRVHRLR